MKKMGRYMLFAFLFMSFFVLFPSFVHAANTWDLIGDFGVLLNGDVALNGTYDSDGGKQGNYKFDYSHIIKDTGNSYIKDGRNQLTIAFGCTGGKHRSVTFAELIGSKLQDKFNCMIIHRDINKI